MSLVCRATRTRKQWRRLTAHSRCVGTQIGTAATRPRPRLHSLRLRTHTRCWQTLRSDISSLGERGLERLRDGDPSVRKDWLLDEVLRRMHNDGDEPLLQRAITSSFALVGSMQPLTLSQLIALVGLDQGRRLWSSRRRIRQRSADHGGNTSAAVTFKLALSGKSFDFEQHDVVHDCPGRAKFLGMKTTFYLQCEHTAGSTVSVRVAANAFTVTGREGHNVASQPFILHMT